MNTGLIAVRYAEALEAYARESEREQEVYADVCLLLTAMKAARSEEDMQRQTQLLSASVTSMGPCMQRFVRMIIRNGRTQYLPLILHSFIERFRTSHGIASARLVTATDRLQQPLQEKITSLLLENGFREVDFKVETDPTLIGGYTLQIRDRRVDASLATQLRILRTELAEKNHQL